MNGTLFASSLGVAALLTLVAPASAPDRPPPAALPRTSTEELGRLLFWDPILSGHRDVACATCHHPDFAWADGRELSLGALAVGLGPARVDASGGRIPVVKRNSPTILNTAFNGLERRRRNRRGDGVVGSTPTLPAVDAARAPMFWDRRVRGLELQALEPLKSREEMRGDAYPEVLAVDSVVARLQSIPAYVALFGAAFGSAPIDAAQLGRAIAAYERTLVAVNSPLDRYRAGDSTALTAQQRRGLDAFDDAGCDGCHRGPMFSDFDLHAEGVREHPLLAAPDTGGARFRFRTPTLRNVALTPPFMHNGTIATLPEVLRFYDRGRSENPAVVDRGPRRNRGEDEQRPRVPTLDGRFRGVDDMSDREMADIVAFLEALSDPTFDRSIPARVPSGLAPGGNIATRVSGADTGGATTGTTSGSGRSPR
jgi:cytochrome c peroxidase